VAGVVRACTHRTSGVKYAVKCLDLGMIKNPEDRKQVREEISVMCQLDHPNIVRLEEVYESYDELYLVLELCQGGELFDRLEEQPDYHYTERQCARLVKQMLSSIRYIHTKGIVHRDLKLENYLFSTKHADAELKMIDFGLSKHFTVGEEHHDTVGTLYTAAPEVIRGKYDEQCDMWGLGVLAYLVLSGDPPFGGCGGPEPMGLVRNNILAGNFKFEPEDIWADVSEDGKNFIRSLLVTNPKERLTARQAQKSKWIQEWATEDGKHDNKLNPSVVKALATFKEYDDIHKLFCQMVSFALLPEQIQDLRKEFEKLDKDGSGEISIDNLKQVLVEGAGAGSLGAITEEEVEEICNSMVVRKTDRIIRWHEFIAAGMSHCKVDDRNLRMAFDRLDGDHKGYVIIDDITNLIGSHVTASGDSIEEILFKGLDDIQCQSHIISYNDFQLLMKGQKKSAPKLASDKPFVNRLSWLEENAQFHGRPDLEPTVHAALPAAEADELDEWGFYDEEDEGDEDAGDPFFLGTFNSVLTPLNEEPEVKSALMPLNEEPEVKSAYDGPKVSQMRQAVLDGIKRFDEEEEMHVLKAHKMKSKKVGAGLVMRRGETRSLSSEEVRKILLKQREKQMNLLEVASKKCGRGARRGVMKKTISDMSSLMGANNRPKQFRSSSGLGANNKPKQFRSSSGLGCDVLA